MDAAVIDVLQRAGSQDPNVLKPAEQTLREWETQRGFYTALFNVFSNHTLQVNVRWLAVLYFKNGVDRYWRKGAPGQIADDEKEFLRGRLISRFDEPVNQLALQISVLIAKIARFDCPREWNSLVPTILEVIRGQDPLAQHRALLTLHHVVKTLASKRLPADKKLFHELTTNVFIFILNLWNTYTESFLILVTNGGDIHQVQETLEKALLLLRILRKLVINGFHKPSESPDAMLFLNVIFERARTSLECRKTLTSRGIHLDVCDKFIIQVTKVLIGILENHPFCFVELIPRSLEFSVFYCFTEAGQNLAFERFLIQSLNLMKTILLSNDYRPAKVLEETKNPLTLRAHQLKQDFFTVEALNEICNRLVTHYFVLTPSDLELWDSDPENFVVDDGGESWKYSLRPCTESVFLAIFHQFREVLSAVLVDLMQRHHQLVDPNDLHAILMKDAVYNAVGLAAFDLYDEVNFDQWFSTTLKEELKIKTNNYRIIRRRVCWLIGRWTGIKLGAEFRPELYRLMVEALSPEEDLGVRLAANDALKLAIDDFQFNTEEFSPYLEPAFSLLFALLKEVNECDTKMRVLYVLSFMIERVGSGIKPHICALSGYLPELWQQSEDHNMLRCAIVSTLVHLEKALGSESNLLEPFVVGVISLSCDVNQEGHVYLLEDGLELWLALLENTPIQTSQIMGLFKNMPSLLEMSSENMSLCLYIIQAYVFLSPQEFLRENGTVIIDTLRSILGDLRPEEVLMVMRLFEACLKASPQQATQVLKPLLPRIFESVYKGEEYPQVMSMYLSIVARVFLNSREMFVEVIRELSRQLGGDANEENVLGQITRVWVAKMPLVHQLEQEKLLALVLCFLLDASSPPSVLQFFPQILSNIIEALNDITKVDDMGCPVDTLVPGDELSPSQYEDVDYETEHAKRKRDIEINDAVHRVSLKDVLQSQLVTLRRLVGVNQFDLMMHAVSTDINMQLKVYVSLTT
ncbi:importin-11 isoform X2 [Belonocnema kinseyi]|uniref:importin-11 isoform X2 n=1 Tax=Belonocnema kinseyi TaxID=2817044 RepID=UPI00143D6A45|nr:importin-11 isoform X2 [Belonocnema kinseyi]